MNFTRTTFKRMFLTSDTEITQTNATQLLDILLHKIFKYSF